MNVSAVAPPARVQTIASRRHLSDVLVVFTWGVALIIRLLFWGLAEFPDDAYITLHSARVLWAGADHAYPGVAPLVGATSAVHLFLVAAGLTVLPPLASVEATLWLAALLYVLGIVRLVRDTAGFGAFGIGVIVLSLIAGAVPQQLSNGQETGLAMAGVTWAIVLATATGRSRDLGLPLLAGVLPFVRPELAVVPVLVLLAEARRGRGHLIRGALLILLAGLPWAAWYMVQTGAPYPTTVAAKRVFFAEALWPASMKLRVGGAGLAYFAGALGPLGAALLGWRYSHTGRAVAAASVVLCAAYILSFPSALAQYSFRYLYPLLPLFVFGLLALQRARPQFARIVIALALMHSSAAMPGRWRDMREWREVTSVELAPLARWLNANVDHRTPILIHDAGYLSEATRFRLVDLVGLKTPSSTTVHRQVTEPSGGQQRTRAISQIALAHGTPIFVLTPSFLPNTVEGLRNLDWNMTLLHREAEHEWLAYEVYRMTPPGSPE